jgi:hypothetical protein
MVWTRNKKRWRRASHQRHYGMKRSEGVGGRHSSEGEGNKTQMVWTCGKSGMKRSEDVVW